MMRRPPVFAVVTLLLLPAWSWAADEQGSQSGSAPRDPSLLGDLMARTNGDPVLLREGEGYSEWDARLGWWAFWHSGSPAKVGEYQDLRPSPFFDVDGMSSDGTRTLGATITGMDREATLGSLYFFQPGWTARVDYQRFLHRLDHDPLNNMPGPEAAQSSPPQDPKIIKDDLNVGQDYAIRVQELKSSIKWFATENFKARVDVWGLRKEGTRQANAVAMCYVNESGFGVADNLLPPDHPPLVQFAGQRCHVLSQAQHIDWVTQEVKPVFEAHLGDSLVVEYSRPMRGFTADDQTASRFYDRTGRLSFDPNVNPNPYAYGVVPNSYTEMDQLKISGLLAENTRAYAFLMAGHTVNQEIDMTRWFNDVDLRVTNTSINNLTLTSYGKIFNEAEQMPDAATVTAVNQGPEVNGVPNTRPTLAQVTGVLSHPIDYHKSTAGLKGVWRPKGGGFDLGGLAIIGGYEYNDLQRRFAIFDLDTGGVIDQSRTITHGFQIGPDYRWSSRLDTYLRYKLQNADQPLLGVQEPNGLTNTLLPQHDSIVETGFNWVPADWFILNACVGIERGDTHGQFGDSTMPIDFHEQNYPWSLNAWYAVSDRLSMSAGYAMYSNFVAQNITVADQLPFGVDVSAVAPVTSRWNYGGRAQVLSLGSRYAATERVSLTGQVNWIRGHDLVTNSATFFPLSGLTVTDLGSFSQVLNETTRVSLGADWMLRPRFVTYVRYELYNFHDIAPGYQTGLAQGILGGFSAMF